MAYRVNGILYPTLNLPITALPHRHSLDAPSGVVLGAWEATVDGIIRSGATTILIVTGHYAQGHAIELFRFATRMMQTHPNVRIFAAAPLEPLGNDHLLDHAARYETSQLLTIRPELANLDAILDLDPRVSAILGADPREGTVEEGHRLLNQAAEVWTLWIKEATAEELMTWYASREESYSGYVNRYYKESWEQAIQDWWSERSPLAPPGPPKVG
jgi:creatinine amidohydrolase